jgi:general secretion pathway protein I
VLNAYAAVGRGAERDDNIRFARSLLLAEPDREKAEQGDAFDGANGVRVVWRSTIEPTNTADLFNVTLTCEVNDPAAKENRPPATEQFMLLRPTWSQGDEAAKLRAEAKDRIVELRPALR